AVGRGFDSRLPLQIWARDVMTEAGYKQAGIAVERAEEFERLRAAIERALAPAAAAKFLRRLKAEGVRVREFEAVLDRRVFERLGAAEGARALYNALTVSDQALMRELYLTAIEQIAPELRRKFHRQFETY